MSEFFVGSLEARLSTLNLLFMEMYDKINIVLNQNGYQISVGEYRKNDLFHQYFTISEKSEFNVPVNLIYCESYPMEIAKLTLELSSKVMSSKFEDFRISFLTHVSQKLGFVIHIYLRNS